MLRTLVLAIVTTSAPAVAQKDVPRAEPSRDLQGGQTYEWTSDDGAPFWYRMPDKLSPSSPPNLVIMLHGTGCKWGWAFWNYPIAKGAFRPDDVVVAPEALTPGGGDTFNFIQGDKDGDHIAALIESFRAKLPIDRVYLYGHSQGAFFCYWFAGRHPELVDGIVAHAGNVLSVRHSDASREGVAIGILHGEADAVVSVKCAHRSAKIYRDEGYEHVKLEIVEGLTAKSGHWPLPVQVGEMLEWLDEVTEASPQKAADRAVAALEAEPPDLGAVVANLQRARELVKRTKPAEEERFRVATERAAAFVEECRAAHLEAVLRDEAALKARKPDYGPWAARFRAAHAVFAGDREWEKGLGSIARTVKADEKQCVKAVEVLGRGSAKAVRSAVRVLESAVRAPSYEGLRRELAGIAKDPPEGLKDADREELERLLAARQAADAEGAKAAEATTVAVAKGFAERFAGGVEEGAK